MSAILSMLAQAVATPVKATRKDRPNKRSVQRVRVTVLWDELQSLLEREQLTPAERERCAALAKAFSGLKREVRKDPAPHEHREVLGVIEGEQSAEEFAIRYRARLRPSYDKWDVWVRFNANDKPEFASVGYSSDEPEDSEVYSRRVASMQPIPRESSLRSDLDSTDLRKPRMRWWWVKGQYPQRDLSEFRACNRVRGARVSLHLGQLRSVLSFEGLPRGARKLPSNNPPGPLPCYPKHANKALGVHWLGSNAGPEEGWQFAIGPQGSYDRALVRFRKHTARQARIARARLPMTTDGSARVILNATRAVSVAKPRFAMANYVSPLGPWRKRAGAQTAEYATTKRILSAVGQKVIAERVKLLSPAGKKVKQPTTRAVPMNNGTEKRIDVPADILLTGRMLTLTLRRAARLLQGRKRR